MVTDFLFMDELFLSSKAMEYSFKDDKQYHNTSVTPLRGCLFSLQHFLIKLPFSSTLFTLSANPDPDRHISPSLHTSSSSSSPFPPPLISLCSQSVRLHDCHPAHVCGADEAAVCFQVLSLSSLRVWCMYDAWTVGCCRLRRNPEQTGTWCSHARKSQPL